MKKLLLLFFLSLAFLFSFSQAGSPDNTFGTNGKVFTSFGTSTDASTAIAVQSDGKVVLGGYSFNGTNFDFALARYNINGTLDNTFDLDGKVTTAIGTSNDYILAISIQSDGKIVAAGYSNIGSPTDFALARYNADGSLDNTFSGDGKLTTNINGNDFVNAVAIQSDGKIVVTGRSNTDFSLARYNTDGSLDNTFDGDGILTTRVSTSGIDDARAIAIQSDGKIVVAGETGSTFNAANDDFALARYNTDGSLDNTFDGDGKLTTSISPIYDAASSIAIQSDGKIIAAGTTSGSNLNFALVRYNTDGTLDNTFDGDGKLTTDISGNDFANGMIIQSNGKIVVAGRSLNVNRFNFSLARYNTDGTLDIAFDGDGKTTLTFGAGATDWGYDVNLFNNRLYVAGFTDAGGTDDFAVAAFQIDLLPVPLSLISFTASKQNSSVQLNWKTADEINVSYFEIERSVDGRTFEKIKVQSAQNTTIATYNTIDKDVLTGIVYYRLRSVDLDGKFSFSKIVKLDFSKQFTVQISPNPATNRIYIQGAENFKQIAIVDVNGRVIKRLGSSADNYYDVQFLPSGLYWIKLYGAGEIQTHKLIKE